MDTSSLFLSWYASVWSIKSMLKRWNVLCPNFINCQKFNSNVHMTVINHVIDKHFWFRKPFYHAPKEEKFLSIIESVTVIWTLKLNFSQFVKLAHNRFCYCIEILITDFDEWNRVKMNNQRLILLYFCLSGRISSKKKIRSQRLFEFSVIQRFI